MVKGNFYTYFLSPEEAIAGGLDDKLEKLLKKGFGATISRKPIAESISIFLTELLDIIANQGTFFGGEALVTAGRYVSSSR